VMTRGTFANIRLKNMLAPDTEGGYTVFWAEIGKRSSFHYLRCRHALRDEGIPLVVLAGKEYGTGSSRDWAAKGTLLLGVKAVLAESFERIHRSNLVGMGVLPIQYKPGESAQQLGLTGKEIYSLEGLSAEMSPRSIVTVTAARPKGKPIVFQAIARLDTIIEVEYYCNGGILHTVLRNLMKD
jgi:aconitate hydratase